MATIETIKKEYLPSIDDLTVYVSSLTMLLKDGEVKNEDVKDVIKNFPSPIKIKNSMSYEECRLLFENVRWAWKEITGKDLLDLAVVKPAPETLMGNYWMLSGGMLLHGVNHYTIVKQNLNLFASLLDIDPFVLHEKLSGPPKEIIKLVIDHGGVRVFINQDKKAFFQMNDEEYGKWGKRKVKHLDFKEKVVKLIALNTNYDGWKSGFVIVL